MNHLIELPHTSCDTNPAAEKSPGRLVLHCQVPSDQAKVAQICPPDQERLFVGAWDGFDFVLTETKAANTVAAPADSNGDALAKEIAALKKLGKPKLETLAAERGVAWDETASPETMLERVARAKK